MRRPSSPNRCVVEEVVIEKDVREHTETVRDTVRRTEVEVESIGKSQHYAIVILWHTSVSFDRIMTPPSPRVGLPMSTGPQPTATAMTSPLTHAIVTVSGPPSRRRPTRVGAGPPWDLGGFQEAIRHAWDQVRGRR